MRALRASYYAFCALLLGLCAALLISLSVWLEMRVHNRYILAGFVLAGAIYGAFAKKISAAALITSEILMFLLIFWLNKPNLIYYLIKESYLEFFSFSQIRYAFLGVLSLLNALIFIRLFRR